MIAKVESDYRAICRIRLGVPTDSRLERSIKLDQMYPLIIADLIHRTAMRFG